MPFQASWLIEGRLVLLDCEGVMTLEEVKAMQEANIEFLRSSKDVVHIIMDTTKVKRHETSLAGLRQTVTRKKEPNLGWTILVGNNPVGRFFFTVIGQMVDMKMRVFPKREQAIKFVKQMDKSLSESANNS